MSILTKAKPVQIKDQGQLDFGGPDFSAAAYVENAQNAGARAALATWRTWPGGVLALCGEAGSGKSHLGRIWAEDARAPVLDGAKFDLSVAAKLSENGQAVALIDHADSCDETALFGLLTGLESQGGAVLLLARTPPKAWGFNLPDLTSRLGAVAYETLNAPEPEFLAQLIIRQSAARGFKIDETASTYLANRIPRTFEATADIAACMQEVNTGTLKSPLALAQRALQALYRTQGYDDQNATPDLFDL